MGLTVQTQFCAHFMMNEAGERQVAFRCLHTYKGVLLFPMLGPVAHFLLHSNDIRNEL